MDTVALHLHLGLHITTAAPLKPCLRKKALSAGLISNRNQPFQVDLQQTVIPAMRSLFPQRLCCAAHRTSLTSCWVAGVMSRSPDPSPVRSPANGRGSPLDSPPPRSPLPDRSRSRSPVRDASPMVRNMYPRPHVCSALLAVGIPLTQTSSRTPVGATLGTAAGA